MTALYWNALSFIGSGGRYRFLIETGLEIQVPNLLDLCYTASDIQEALYENYEVIQETDTWTH